MGYLAVAGQSALAPKLGSKVGWLRFKAGRWAEAAEIFEMVLARCPSHDRPVELLYALGLAYQQIGRTDEAIKVYKGLVGRLPPGDQLSEKVKARMAQIAR